MRKTVKAWAWKTRRGWESRTNRMDALDYSRLFGAELHPCTITIDVKEKKRGKRKADRE